MGSRQVRRLVGMRDVVGRAYEVLGQPGESFGTYLGSKGYEVIDTPLLEETELFVRKSGGELTSRLYSFIEPGGHRVSLRPEFTSSVIRHFIQERETLTLPVRWQYGGPVFRYERERQGAYRQFTQVGAELIGAGGVEADAEVLALAALGLRETGLRGFRIRVGHLGVLHDLLASLGLSGPTILFVIRHVQSLNNGGVDVGTLMRQASEIGLLTAELGSATDEDLMEMGKGASRELIHRVLTEAMPGPTGRRTTDEIVDRLLRKVREADDPVKVERGLALVAELARVEDSPSSALKRAQKIVAAHGLSRSALDDLGKLFAELGARGVDESQLVLDLGLARGISYYSGVIFEITDAGSSDGPSLGGGGRYDGLVKALGGEDVPALGFAYTVEDVVNALERQSSGAAYPSPKPSGLG